MKTYLDCLPCFMRQALRAGRIATKDEKKIKVLLDEVGCMTKEMQEKGLTFDVALGNTWLK